MYLLYTINCKHEENLRLLILHSTEASSVNISIDILRILLHAGNRRAADQRATESRIRRRRIGEALRTLPWRQIERPVSVI